jgi:hypothetical protein
MVPASEPAPTAVTEPPPARALEPEPVKQAEAEPTPEPVAAAAAPESTTSTDAPAPPPEPSRPPLLFVERGGRSRARDEDEDEDEKEDDEIARKIALARDLHRQATKDEDDEDAERELKASEPVLLWPGPRDQPAPAAAAPAASASPADHERPPSFVFLDPNHVAALPPRLRHLAEEFWRLTARWRALPRNIRYGSPAAAAVLILALVWWRVAKGHEERGTSFVIENPPAGLDGGTPRPVPPRPAPPRTRTAAPRSTTPTGGTTTPPPRSTSPGDSSAQQSPTGQPAGGAAVEPAHLYINSSPWGVLFIDGRQIGNTPQFDVRVPPGTHTIRITRDGYLPYEAVVALESGDPLRLTDIVLHEKPQ